MGVSLEGTLSHEFGDLEEARYSRTKMSLATKLLKSAPRPIYWEGLRARVGLGSWRDYLHSRVLIHFAEQENAEHGTIINLSMNADSQVTLMEF